MDELNEQVKWSLPTKDKNGNPDTLILATGYIIQNKGDKFIIQTDRGNVYTVNKDEIKYITFT